MTKDLSENTSAPHGEYINLIQSIGQLLGHARAQIAANVNTVMVQTYWHIGKYCRVSAERQQPRRLRR